MARVTRIDILVATGHLTHGGTNGRVYAGVGGCEFVLDSVGNDFQANTNLLYVIGDGSNLKHEVDLEFLLMDTADVLAYPVYIRFEPNGALDKWELNMNQVRVSVNPSEENLRFTPPFSEPTLVLSSDSGKYLYLLPAT
jgi:hypothetical protein